jgi:hypothetical protein
MNFRVKSNGVDPIGLTVFVKTCDLAEFLKKFNRNRVQLVARQLNKPIWAKDLHSGDVTSFKSRGLLAEFFGVSLATVSGWLKDRDQVVVNGHYLLKQKEYEPWREFNAKIDQVRIGRGRDFVTINDKTKEQKLYRSALSFCKETGLTPTCVNYRLSTKGGRVFSDGNRYVYQDEIDTVRLPTGNR